jgi:endonuclease YncB( thermonuclease family)
MLRSHFIEILAVILAMVVLSPGASTQVTSGGVVSEPAPPSDPCGDPAITGSFYSAYQGRVAEVLNLDSIVIDLRNVTTSGGPQTPLLGTYRVRLAGLEDPGSRSTYDRCLSDLRGRITGKTVAVSVNELGPVDFPGFPVIIELDGIDINQWLLETGCARYLKKEPYEVGGWLACQYRLAEKTARENRIGIWGETVGERSN